ncbi:MULTISPECIES: DUF1449 domain-containing protein [Psychrobacter]|jgi:hypothetical protein|uniref:DUF1449 domain-containing protein n=1 Tax=Psychrobacter TaxID=497 RepID=UPI00106786D1|nr:MULTISPECIES: DUF1449 domain-containing protein [Psychrobacter]TEW83123.1 DUF1449 domain-containing protein [Psychrobacter sp. 230]
MQEAFFVFITKISLYPTIVFTGLVMFVTLYWVVSLLGMADMDSVDAVETGSDAAVSDLSSTGFFTGLMLKFGLYGVPLVIILSLVSLIGWLLSYLYTSFLHQNFDSGVLYYVFGTGALIFVLVVSMWLTGMIISPIRKNIARIPKRNSANNVGKIAIVRTLSVTDKHGEAELNDGGAGLILKVRSDNSTSLLKKGDRVMLIAYLEETNTYQVARVEDK